MRTSSVKLHGVAVVAALALLVPASAVSHASGMVFSAFGTPTLDGVVAPGEWEDAATREFVANTPGGATVPGELRVMNDASNLYFAVRLGTGVPTTSVAVGFDNDHDGIRIEEGADGMAFGFGVRNTFADTVLSSRGGCPPGFFCGFHDTDLGGTQDGLGLRTFQAGETHVELSHPLNSADDANDISVGPGDVVGFGFQVVICTDQFACAFTVVVPFGPMGDIRVATYDPAADLADLAAAVEGVGPGASLTAKVRAAQSALTAGDFPRTSTILSAFINQVSTQSGKSIPTSTADALIAHATRIRDAFGG